MDENKNMDDKQKVFLEYFNPLKERLWRFCLNLSRSRESAKDLLQDTIEAAYRNFGSIRHKEAFLSYLFTIASRAFYKIKQEQSKFEQLTELQSESLVSMATSPYDKAELTDFYSALAQIPVEMKESIILFDIMGFSRKEICEIQSVSLEGLKARLYRGRKKLAELLGANQDIELNDSSAKIHNEGVKI